MLISIITINKDNCNGLKETMQSVFCQNWKSIEYIVIDGGSLDESVSFLQLNSNNLKYWESSPDNGVYDAQNKGLAKASGEFVLFLNSGDIFCCSNSVTELANFAKKNTIVYGDLMVSDNRGSHWLKTYPDKLPQNYFDNETLPHPSSLIPTKLLREAGGYDASLRITADWKFFREVFINRKANFFHVNKPISQFDITGISSLPQNQKIIETEKDRERSASANPKGQFNKFNFRKICNWMKY